MAVLSKGIKLSYKEDGTSNTYHVLTNLLEIPDLGGTTESVEITTLADSAHTYMDGLKNYGDSLDFKFLYSSDTFTTLSGVAGKKVQWKVELPEGESCSFNGTGSVRLDGVGVNAALTFTLSVKPSSAMTWA